MSDDGIVRWPENIVWKGGGRITRFCRRTKRPCGSDMRPGYDCDCSECLRAAEEQRVSTSAKGTDE
jgi:hypothetical protein